MRCQRRGGQTSDFRAAPSAAITDALRGPTPPAEEAPPALPELELPSGPAAEAADFVTGSVLLNRMHRRLSELNFEEKRALIYGGDMIVP